MTKQQREEMQTKTAIINQILTDHGFQTKKYLNCVIASLSSRKVDTQEIWIVMDATLEGIKLDIRSTSDGVRVGI